jgi:hypothetical protein
MGCFLMGIFLGSGPFLITRAFIVIWMRDEERKRNRPGGRFE